MAEQVELNNNDSSSDDDNHPVFDNKNDAKINNQSATPLKNLNKVLRKPGKTLLVKSFYNFDETQLNNIAGVKNIFKNALGDTIFVEFDSVANSIKGMKEIRMTYSNSHNIKVKFSYYKLFFTLTGLNQEDDYNTIKKGLIDVIGDKASVLYCKLYCKDKKYIGCGDLTVDTLEGMNYLLSKDGGLKEFNFDKYSGIFYKFNNKK